MWKEHRPRPTQRPNEMILGFLIVLLTSTCLRSPESAYPHFRPPLCVPTMRWPRMTRKSRTIQSEPEIFRANTVATTNSEAPNDVSHDDLSIRSPHSANPGLSQMFTDAALYERVLTAGPDSIKTCLLSEATSEEALPMCIGSFNELIGRDLADEERMVTGRLAKLSVNNWDASGDDPFGVDGLSEEDQGEAGSPDRGEDEKPSRLMTSSPTVQEEQPEEPKLTSEEVVDLLEQEFGALAAPGEEKLLLETDAAFFKDVVILVGPPRNLLPSDGLRFPVIFQGVVHVTTHRFTFHASLLSSQPGYNEKVVKSGSALIHHKGLHRKKRVWLQLDHDMISSFASSRDEDKIKPLRSILCSYLSYAAAIRLLIPFRSVHDQGNQGRRLGAAPDYRRSI